jgi:hypothetical protein
MAKKKKVSKIEAAKWKRQMETEIEAAKATGVASDATDEDIGDVGVDLVESAEKNTLKAATTTAGLQDKVTTVPKNNGTSEPVEQQTATAAAESMNEQVAVGSQEKAIMVPNVAVAAIVATGEKTEQPVQVSMATMLVDIIATNIAESKNNRLPRSQTKFLPRPPMWIPPPMQPPLNRNNW